MKFNLASLFLSCAASFAVAQDASIAELAIATPELSSLVALVQAADLAEVLSSADATYTVFAPTNDALADVDAKYTTESWKTHLTNILTYHVLDSEVFSTGISDGLVITALSKENFTATVNDTGVFLGSDSFSSQVTTADIDASNGVVHLVSAFFLPSWMSLTLADIALNVEGFDQVATFITQAGLEDEIAAPNRSIFAPNGDAFAAISPELTAQIVNDESLIGVILKRHIVEGVWSKASLTDGLELTTLDGEMLMITVSGDSYMVADSAIVEFDVLASNGVSHVISTIIETTPSTPTVSPAPAGPVEPTGPTPAGPTVPTPVTPTSPTPTTSNALALGSALSLFAAAVVALF